MVVIGCDVKPRLNSPQDGGEESLVSSDTVRVPSDSVAYVEIYETPSAARWALALPLAVGGYFLLMAVIDRFTEW